MAPDDALPPDSTTAGSTAAAPAALDLTVLPALDAVVADLAAPLAAWMPQQRWFAHKGRPDLSARVAGWALLAADASSATVDLIVEVSSADRVLAPYQVPVLLRGADAEPSRDGGSPQDGGAPQAGGAAAGEASDPSAAITYLESPTGILLVEDALRTAQGRRAIALWLSRDGQAAGPGARLSAASRPDLTLPDDVPSRVLGGEQSNTSVILEPPGSTPVILKLFRVLADGDNPDVVLQGALTDRGSRRVPPVLGSVRIAADGLETAARPAPLRAHAAVAQEFLPGVEDAWRVALAEAVAGADPEESIRELGATLAEVHRDLADALGTAPADAAARSAMVAQMVARLEEVAEEVPQVAAHRDRLAAVIARAGEVSWPALQRIHGDLHLGQVLRSERGWILLDFEGEPLRPLAQRSAPDAPQRDVAGMLRSFDYVAGAVARERGLDVSAWSARARTAFLEGYGTADGVAPDDWAVLLAAFEADKAVYEALYEARNRPDWLEIPLSALERISG